MSYRAMHVRLAALRVLALFFCLCAPAGASTLAEMDHRAWTARDGAPQGIVAMAQAADGVMWIGAVGGLYTFDGRAFNTYQSPSGQPDLPAGSVYSVRATREGAVWAAFFDGGLARIDHGRITIFHRTVEGQELSSVQHLTQAPDGSMWGLIAQGYVIRFGNDGKWHRVPAPLPIAKGRIRDLFVDSFNTLWLAQGGLLYRRPANQTKYEATEVPADWIFGFTQAPDGSLWVTDVQTDIDSGRTQHVDPSGRLLATLPYKEMAYGVLSMPDGSVVVATQSKGLVRFSADALRNPPPDLGRDAFTHLDGLSFDGAKVVLTDLDGNIWAAGSKGVDRFRKARLMPFKTVDSNGDWHVCNTPAGEVWIAGIGSGQFYKVSNGATTHIGKDGYNALSCADDGSVIAVDNAGAWQIQGERRQLLPKIPGTTPYGLGDVVALPDRSVIAVVGGARAIGGIYQFKDGRWSRRVLPGNPPRIPQHLYVDPHGRLWGGYTDGLTVLPLEGRFFRSGMPGLGTVHAMLETSRGMLSGGTNGLAVLRGDHFQMLRFADRSLSLGIGGLVESLDGDLWMDAARGIIRIRAADLAASLKNPALPLKAERIVEGEFVGPVETAFENDSTARDAQGGLWFVTMNGVAHIDPAHMGPESHPPIVSIRSAAVDGKPLAANAKVEPKPETLDIQYLGVNLTAPENVVYRYRLDGLDDAWQYAGHRTESIYTRLGPGTYTFRVSASNGNGAWTEPVSTGAFTVLPSFYQTTWFRVLCGLIVLFLLWLAYGARIRFISQSIRARAEERADERIRIARELHDTLLQGVQGMLLTFHVAAQEVPADEESRRVLDNALSVADRIIIEGRNRVNSLRSEHLTDGELVSSLENLGKDLDPRSDIRFEVRRHGSDAVLRAAVADEVFYIAREALTNAFRHAGAGHIAVELNYGRRYFSMSCIDDGAGFDTQRAQKPGHWGLLGMAERAEIAGGNLRVQPRQPHGTAVLLSVPSWRAYENVSRLAFYLGALRSPERDPAGS